jgi:hypothetical protein
VDVASDVGAWATVSWSAFRCQSITSVQSGADEQAAILVSTQAIKAARRTRRTASAADGADIDRCRGIMVGQWEQVLAAHRRRRMPIEVCHRRP